MGFLAEIFMKGVDRADPVNSLNDNPGRPIGQRLMVPARREIVELGYLDSVPMLLFQRLDRRQNTLPAAV